MTLITRNNNGCTDTTTKKFLLKIDTGNIFSNKEMNVCRGSQFRLPGDSAAVQNYWSPASYLDSFDIYDPVCRPAANIRYQYNIVKKSGNLVNNANFSDGNVGFSSKYTYDSLVNGPGYYFISANAQLWNPGFQKCPCDTVNSVDTMLIVSGSTQNNLSVWNSTISVAPNTNYIFAFVAESLSFTDSLELQSPSTAAR